MRSGREHHFGPAPAYPICDTYIPDETRPGAGATPFQVLHSLGQSRPRVHFEENALSCCWFRHWQGIDPVVSLLPSPLTGLKNHNKCPRKSEDTVRKNFAEFQADTGRITLREHRDGSVHAGSARLKTPPLCRGSGAGGGHIEADALRGVSVPPPGGFC